MSIELLRPLIADPRAAGVFLDFDGTLSHIVTVASDARPLSGVVETLAELHERYGLVSIVSGRSAHQLLDWLGPKIEIWGVHGAETTYEGKVVLAPRAEQHWQLMRRVYDEARDRISTLDLPGVLIEDKGVMVGLHFRAASDVERARHILDGVAAELATKHGLLRAGGRLAFELRPPEPFSKSDVILTRSRALGLRAVMFIGDDRVDLPGFDALDELARTGVATVRVAVSSDEVPEDLVARADVVVEGPEGCLDLLSQLL